MRRFYTRLTRVLMLLGVMILLSVAAAWLAGFRMNTTVSIPLGIYRLTDDPLVLGSYVIFCPPDNAVFHDARERGYISAGFCPAGYGYMMKRILAAKDDVVSVSDDGVRVNGDLLSLSVPLPADGDGRPMPKYRVTQQRLRDTELLLMSDITALSFDGRYFGPIDHTQIVGVIKPVMIW